MTSSESSPENPQAAAVDSSDTAQKPPTGKDGKNRTPGLLGVIERLGNLLPNPFWLFICLGAIVLVISWIGSLIGMSAEDPETGETVEVANLLSADGLQSIVTNAVTNFTEFPPLGVIITVMLGVAVAEHAGLISAAVRGMVARTGPKTLTFVVALTAVTGSVASDAIFIIMIPLGAMAFNALGRSPIVGAVVAFAGSAAGFDASLLLNITDVLLAGISTSAAQLVDPNYEVNPLSNYYFVIGSSIVLAAIITVLTEFFMDKKIYQIVNHDEVDYSQVNFTDDKGEVVTSLKLNPSEVKGLKLTGLVFIACLAVYFALLFVSGSPLQGEGGAVMESPLINNIAVPIAVIFFILGLVYGLKVKTITKSTDVPDFMAKGLESMLPILVLFFVVAQFVAWFDESNLGVWLSVKGSDMLQSWNLPPVLLFAGFVLMVAFLNMMITSGSAQWALMAPVVVPMMMYLGIAPEVSQMLYRIGDSATAIVTPMNPYFAMAFAFILKYYRKAGLGTIMSMMIPYCLVIMVGWFLFFVAWWALGIPLGPGAPMEYPAQ
ncbi:MAG TPA: AbgT family transporter [Candidatus Corynebacterium avicola]|uniref:AbgT family transporter n=1 Tax=Candidatus Corynebacterium avicola TaxID=2838527 RepID=A0A9D1RPY9_9CORY|nr:AbgT family transporter [Candidatus Corynebacterium avicola]